VKGLREVMAEGDALGELERPILAANMVSKLESGRSGGRQKPSSSPDLIEYLLLIGSIANSFSIMITRKGVVVSPDNFLIVLAVLALVGGISFARSLRCRHSRPPVDAKYFLQFLMTHDNCEAILGDLQEQYEAIYSKGGLIQANLWYWTQVIRSVGPIALAWGKKAMMRPVIGVAAWAVAKGFVGHDSWLAALVELWKRIRS
jgi:hypothetical protein